VSCQDTEEEADLGLGSSNRGGHGGRRDYSSGGSNIDSGHGGLNHQQPNRDRSDQEKLHQPQQGSEEHSADRKENTTQSGVLSVGGQNFNLS
jgi:hypothetical protein